MYALIHNSQLILGPIKYNYRLINSELEDLEVNARVTPRSAENVPIQFDSETFLLPCIEILPPHDSRFQSVGNFDWAIIQEDGVPVRVEATYAIHEKSLETVKYERKQQVAPIRREKESTWITINLNDTIISVSTSRENRLALLSKLMSSSGPYLFKFDSETWVEVTKSGLEVIISQIDSKVQEAFDWEYAKLQEIDACSSKEDVYNVVLRESEGGANALPTDY